MNVDFRVRFRGFGLEFLVNICSVVGFYWSRGVGASVLGRFFGEGVKFGRVNGISWLD